MKIEGTGSLSQRHGSAVPDPHKNVMDPQHCLLQMYRIRREDLTCRGSLWWSPWRRCCRPPSSAVCGRGPPRTGVPWTACKIRVCRPLHCLCRLRDIERLHLSSVLHTLKKSFRHYSLPRVVWGVMWEVKSMPRISKSAYGEKVFLNIFISMYVNLNGFRANRYE